MGMRSNTCSRATKLALFVSEASETSVLDVEYTGDESEHSG